MDFLDHPVLYSDKYHHNKWNRLYNDANGISPRRKKARRKMRKIIGDLLKGVKPRIFRTFD